MDSMVAMLPPHTMTTMGFESTFPLLIAFVNLYTAAVSTLYTAANACKIHMICDMQKNCISFAGLNAINLENLYIKPIKLEKHSLLHMQAQPSSGDLLRNPGWLEWLVNR